MKAKKGNKVYSIEPKEADGYAARGFDIYEGAKLVKHAKGKSVPIEEYERVLAEVEVLKKQLAEKPEPKPRAKKEA